MTTKPERPLGRMNSEPERPFDERLSWFIVLWAGGVAVVGAVAYAIRAVLL